MMLSNKLALSLALAIACGTASGSGMTGANVPEDKVDFEKAVWPIIEAKCVQCHGAHREGDGQARKPKAGLRLDAACAILAGGDDGKVLAPGDGANSEMWWRTNLPPDSEDFMPPQGKAEPLIPEEKTLLKRWIDQGADFGGWEGNLVGKPEEDAKAGDKIRLSDLQMLYRKLGEDLAPLDAGAWKSVTAAGGRVQPLAPGSPLLSVDFRLVRGKADADAIETVGAIRENVAQFDASGTSITGATLAGIGKMTYLNLYGTAVTDTGLKALESMKDLDQLHLWQSQVTAQGVDRLQNALPDTRIVWE